MILEFSFQDFDNVKASFDPKVVQKALRTTITRTARKARTEVSKQIRSEYTVKAKTIKDTVSLRTKRTAEDTVSILSYRGGSLPIDRFSVSQRRVSTSSGPRRGVSVRIRKNGGRKVLKGGFKLRGQKADPTMERVGDSRLPIKRVTSLSVPQMINDDVERAVSERIGIDANIELNRNLAFFQERAR
jgi:hypothetical protein